MEFLELLPAFYDITLQFLIETMALTGLGGILGIAAGFLCEPAYKLGLGLIEDFSPSIFESFPPSMKNMTPDLVIWSLPLVYMTAVQPEFYLVFIQHAKLLR